MQSSEVSHHSQDLESIKTVQAAETPVFNLSAHLLRHLQPIYLTSEEQRARQVRLGVSTHMRNLMNEMSAKSQWGRFGGYQRVVVETESHKAQPSQPSSGRGAAPSRPLYPHFRFQCLRSSPLPAARSTSQQRRFGVHLRLGICLSVSARMYASEFVYQPT